MFYLPIAIAFWLVPVIGYRFILGITLRALCLQDAVRRRAHGSYARVSLADPDPLYSRAFPALTERGRKTIN